MYEVVFKSRGFSETGLPDGEEVVFRKTIGSPEEETPLEELSKLVLKQLARRDVFVRVDGISEYIRKPVNFKSVPGGLVIKNRRFSLDDAFSIVAVEEPTALPAVMPPQQLQVVKPAPAIKPLRFEIYEPQIPSLISETRRRGCKFTLKKKYPIFEEKGDERGIEYGMTYVTQDDNGFRRTMNSLNFVPEADPNLVGRGLDEDPIEQFNLV